MVKIKFEEIVEGLDCKVIDFQKETLKKVVEFLNKYELYKFNYSCSEGLGLRGKYRDTIISQIELVIELKSFKIEFYISYDQLEYYIFNTDNRLLNKCILEDFLEGESHINRFMEFLHKDFHKLKIQWGI